MRKIYSLLIFLLSFFGIQNVDGACPVSISAGGPTGFCSGDSVILTATTGTGYSFQWYNNNIVIAGATAQTFTVKTTGNYAVQVTVASPSCSSFSNVIPVTVVAPLSPTVTEPGTSLCS